MNYDSNERKQMHKKIKANQRKKAMKYQEALDLASPSTQRIPVNVEASTAYVVNFSDLHSPEGHLQAFKENLKTFAKIPNIHFIFGGDQINNSIKGSVGDTHGEIMTPREQVGLLADIIKEVDEEYPVIDKVIAILSGNHENRTYKNVSEDPAYWLALELGIADRYVKNIAEIEFNLQKKAPEHNTPQSESQKAKEETVTTRAIVTHAEQVTGRPAAQAQHGLDSMIDAGADVVVYGHNHKVVVASDIKQEMDPATGKVSYKDVTFMNFGSYQRSSEYANRALYPYPRISDMEVLRISNTGGDKNKVDMINARTLINETIEKRINALNKAFADLEKTHFKTYPVLRRTYVKEIRRLYKEHTKKYKQDKKIKEEFENRGNTPSRLYFAPLSGFYIGSEDSEDASKANIEQIKSKINTLSKLNGSCKVTLSDVVYYKKAITPTNKNGQFLGENFPEESFANILTAAELLSPIKNKIVAYNSGEQEQKIMRHHSEALAKMAMIRLQMDESLCYEPYNEINIATEKLNIQSKQVDGYNKSVLNREVEKAYKDIEKTINECLPYKIDASIEKANRKGVEHNLKTYDEMSDEERQKEFNKVLTKYESLTEDGIEISEKGKAKYDSSKNERLDYLKDIMVPRLRAEGKLLSMKEDKEAINHKFPLEDIELRTPNEKLIQNIFCHMLDINPEKIEINTEPNTSTNFLAKVKDSKGRIRNVAFSGSSFKSVAGRPRIDNYLKGKGGLISGANVYYTNTKVGKEFIVLDVKKSGNKMTDTVYISAGSLSPSIEGQTSANKIYKFFATPAKNKKKDSFGIYENLEKDFNLHCESLNYETVLLEDEIFSDIVKEVSKSSHLKSLKELQAREAQERLQTFNQAIEGIFNPQPRQAKAKPKPVEQKPATKKPAAKNSLAKNTTQSKAEGQTL